MSFDLVGLWQLVAVLRNRQSGLGEVVQYSPFGIQVMVVKTIFGDKSTIYTMFRCSTVVEQTSGSIGASGDLFKFVVREDLAVELTINSISVWALVGVITMFVLFRLFRYRFGRGSLDRFEIDQAQFGIGDQKISLRPNDTDRQIAYKIWVELSTRKIGLAIDLDHDVISEVYDSWYQFFAVTRELIKDVPVTKFRRKDTEKIIRLSIDVLNTGIRPHLTMWQARFRRWYEHALAVRANDELAPQDVQKQFGQFGELKEDLQLVNKRLIQYRDKMYELVSRA